MEVLLLAPTGLQIVGAIPPATVHIHVAGVIDIALLQSENTHKLFTHPAIN
jgi:hypothetical protein